MKTEELYKSCTQCPRNCHVDRTQSTGFCGETSTLRIAIACLHFGEEPVLTVENGSGTIFLSGCTLRCSFCQNYQISQQGMGKHIDVDEFARICLELEKNGAENINIVTGSHHIPKIAEGLKAAKEMGLSIPVAWNSSAYESIESLELLKGLVDIWLPDFKTMNPIMSRELFQAEDYPQVAKKAIRWMMENSPLKLTEKNGREKILSGVIIRHLVLPGRIDDSLMALEWLKKHADSRAIISLMSQYTPVPFKGSEKELDWRKKSLCAFQNRLMSSDEDRQIRDLIDNYSFEYLFYQDLSDDTSWLPDFSRRQTFSNALSKTIWHHSD